MNRIQICVKDDADGCFGKDARRGSGEAKDDAPAERYCPVRKESHMLIPQQAQSGTYVGQGCPEVSFAELRRQLANPSAAPDGHRQRLLDLARRLARVQALGDEYSRVDFSPQAAAALAQHAAAV